MSDTYDLARFVEAQEAGGTYRSALAELRNGRKVSHWMWFVFPQLAGLGRSSTARHFAISSVNEARAFLEHEVLGPRLREATEAVADLRGLSAMQIFGSVDAMKLHSSMTLFALCGTDSDAKLFRRVLDQYFGGRTDDATNKLLGMPDDGH
jgi:uncharacterized protein (DUF1810 family)